MRVALRMPLAEVPVILLEAWRSVRVGVDHDGVMMDARRALLSGFLLSGGLVATGEPKKGESCEKEEMQ